MTRLNPRSLADVAGLGAALLGALAVWTTHKVWPLFEGLDDGRPDVEEGE